MALKSEPDLTLLPPLVGYNNNSHYCDKLSKQLAYKIINK